MDPFCYLCFVIVWHTVLSVPCSLVVPCWQRADRLALLYVMFSRVFVIFPYDVLSEVRYLIVSISRVATHVMLNLSTLTNFFKMMCGRKIKLKRCIYKFCVNLCFVMYYFVSILDLQSSCRGRESLMFCYYCLTDVLLL